MVRVTRFRLNQQILFQSTSEGCGQKKWVGEKYSSAGRFDNTYKLLRYSLEGGKRVLKLGKKFTKEGEEMSRRVVDTKMEEKKKKEQYARL